MATLFRPTAADLARIGSDVKPIFDIQNKLVARHPDLKVPDRVAHQYQVAGGKALLRIDEVLPANFVGVGLFSPGAQYTGIGRISTGLGCPHLETDPDFLGLMVAFQTSGGQRVDFITINDPAAPTDIHPQFIRLLEATADAAGGRPVFGGGSGLGLGGLAARTGRLFFSLLARLGPFTGTRIFAHVTKQTLRTSTSTTAYQTYWTGIFEVGGELGKFMFAPASDENPHRPPKPGERHLSEEWRERQARGDIDFTLYWLPFIDEQHTSTTRLTKAWQQQPVAIGRVTFPKTDGGEANAVLWASLAAELGANPGNWVANTGNTIPEPATEFTCARKLAYQNSQAGRGALSPASYAHVFSGHPISPELAAELLRRRGVKDAAGHIDMAP